MSELKECVEFFVSQLKLRIEQERISELEGFPRGCCNNSAYLIGTYLELNGFDSFEVVEATCKKLGNWKTHSWLQKGDITIDITKAQFLDHEGDSYIEVSPKWLSKWNVFRRGSSNLFRHRKELGCLYNRIIPPTTHA